MKLRGLFRRVVIQECIVCKELATTSSTDGGNGRREAGGGRRLTHAYKRTCARSLPRPGGGGHQYTRATHHHGTNAEDERKYI